MATQKRPIVADLDFSSVKEDLVQYFKSREEFKDYEFTGSGLNLLMDILAYNTHYNALTANMLLNESFLDSALLRANVVSLAKALNYTPRSAKCAVSNITVRVNRTTSDYVIIPTGTTFIASASGTNSRLTFQTIKPHTVQFDTGETTKDIVVQAYEGEKIVQRFLQTSANSKYRYFDLGNENIDTSTIVVSVNNEKYLQLTPEVEGIVKATGTDNCYFIQETRNRTHRIIFGDGKVGKALSVGDEIIVSYLVSSGEDGNGVNSFSFTNVDSTVFSIISTDVSTGGDTPETIREIRENAPHWFQSQYRAVTEKDYEMFLKKKYGNIQAISVYGGEKVSAPGKVFICIKPKTGDFLSSATKAAIVSDVIEESNVVTITPVIVDASYINIILKTTIVYDDNILVSTPEYLETLTLTLFDTFNSSYLGEFLRTFRVSQLSSEIQNLDESIISSNTRVSLRIDISTKNQKLDKYSFSFGNKLYHPEEGFKASTGGIFSTTPFYRVGKNFTSGLDDDGRGKIRFFNLINGEKVYINTNAGTINYDTGQIELLIEIDAVDGTLEFFGIPDSFDVISDTNTVLRISTNTSKVKAIEKNNTSSQRTINLSRSI